MKRYLSFILAFALMLTLFAGLSMAVKPRVIDSVASAETVEYTDETGTNEKSDMEICVIGSAKKSVTPDYAKVTAVIETLDMDMKKSKDCNFECFEKVLSALKEGGIAEDKIVLDGFTSYPSYDYAQGKTLTGYYSITTFTFEVENLEDIKKFVDIAVENGGASIRNISYELSSLDQVYQDVLLEAIENAKLKAQKITGNDNITVKSVKEEYVYSCSSLYRTYSDVLDGINLIGSIEVEALVNVKFE